MSIYLVLLGLSVWIVSLSCHKMTNSNLQLNQSAHVLSVFFLIAALAILTAIYLLRANTVGTDYLMYSSLIYRSSDYIKSLQIESGFVWLYKIAAQVGSMYIVLVPSLGLFFAGWYLFGRVVNVDQWLSLAFLVICYVYFMTFNEMRAFTAIGIVWMGLGLFIYLRENKKFSFLKAFLIYCCFVGVALIFHASSFFGLILPFLFYLKVTPAKVLFGFLLTTTLFFTKFANKIVPIALSFSSHYMSKYSGSGGDILASGDKGIIAFLPVIAEFFILFGIVYYDRVFVANNGFLTSLFFFELVLFFGAGNSVVSRMRDYVVLAGVFFFSRYFESGTKPVYRLSSGMFKGIILAFLSLYYLLYLFRNNSGIVPYIIR